MNRSVASLASAPGGSARIGGDGKVRKVGVVDRQQHNGALKKDKGKARAVDVQM
jgi:hypothetical protein